MTKANNDEPVVTVQVTLKGEKAKQLMSSVTASGRSTRAEAKIRLEDHLSRFSSLSVIGNAVPRN